MSRFRCQFSDSVKNRTIESPKGVYKVCLEGYFDFNEALVKLMIMNGNMFPTASQFEPGSESDDDSDMNFSEPVFDDVCDAIQLGRDIADKVSRSTVSQSGSKGKGNGEPLPKPKEEPTDPVSEVVE